MCGISGGGSLGWVMSKKPPQPDLFRAELATSKFSNIDQATQPTAKILSPEEMEMESAIRFRWIMGLMEDRSTRSTQPEEEEPAQQLARLQMIARLATAELTEASRQLASLVAHGKDETAEAARLKAIIEELRVGRDDLKDRARRVQEQLAAEGEENNSALDPRESKLLPVRHKDRDFFLADLFEYALKDDGVSMEAPIFTLATKPDLSTWKWASKDGKRSIEVYPSVKGRATQHDKDVLIYCISQLTEALNRGRDDARHRTVRFTVHDFLVTTNKRTSKDDYRRLQEAFERLAGTRVTTDIRTGGERVREGFGIIDSWRIVQKSKTDDRMVAVEITLSRWLYNAVQAFEVLTIHPDYFRLRRPLERRLYELARKHCGQQPQWSIGLELLKEKSGSRASLKEFSRMVREVAADDVLPEYKMRISETAHLGEVKVTFSPRARLLA